MVIILKDTPFVMDKEEHIQIEMILDELKVYWPFHNHSERLDRALQARLINFNQYATARIFLCLD